MALPGRPNATHLASSRHRLRQPLPGCIGQKHNLLSHSTTAIRDKRNGARNQRQKEQNGSCRPPPRRPGPSLHSFDLEQVNFSISNRTKSFVNLRSRKWAILAVGRSLWRRGARKKLE